MNRLRIGGATLAAIGVAALGAACGGSDGDDDAAGAGAGATTTMTESRESSAAAGAAIAVESPSADLRITLDRLLAEHAALAMLATQKGFSGDRDFKAIAAALDQNSVELADAIGSVYGDEARTEFLDGQFKWRAHIGFFVDYTVGLAKKDKAMQKKAVNDLQGYIGSFSGFLAKATGLPNNAVRTSITEHVMQLKGQIDAYAGGRYTPAYSTFRNAYGHMFMTGDAIAGAITEQSPEKFTADDTTEASVDLRANLGRLLGEHAVLAMAATQKGLSGDKDFKAITGALDRNSVELASAIGSVYGDAAKKEFLDGNSKWRAHIGFFVDYTVGVAKKDPAMQKKAVNDLMGYVESFSAFLAKATGLPNDTVRMSINEHVMQLKGQVDAYAAGDYGEAYRLFREAYAHMYMTGDALAGAIVKQNSDDFS